MSHSNKHKSFVFAALILATLTAVFTASVAQAELTPESNQYRLLAQLDGAYDPFVDYSEFDEASDEEADINFFRNGRFFTIGFLAGYRTLTGTMGSIYKPNYSFGLFLTYFFDLRFAMQFNFFTGGNQLSFTSKAGTKVDGNADIQSIGLMLKYYFNTQNVTRGLADLNPYFAGGISTNTRTTTVSGEAAFGRDNAMGFDLGGGIEIPMMRNKMHFGLQLLYQLVTFPDENSEIILNDGTEPTGIFPRGDIFHVQGVLGINF